MFAGETALSKAGNGRRRVSIDRRLRIYFPQRWFNLTDLAL